MKPATSTPNFIFFSGSEFCTEPADRRFFLVNPPSSRPKSAVANCEINSRANLDRDPDAAARFEQRIGISHAAFHFNLFITVRIENQNE